MSGHFSVLLPCVLRRRRHSSSVQLSSHQILWWSRAALEFTQCPLQLKKSIFSVKLTMTCFSLLVFSFGCMGQHGALDVVFCCLFCDLANYSYSTRYVGPGECKYTHTCSCLCFLTQLLYLTAPRLLDVLLSGCYVPDLWSAVPFGSLPAPATQSPEPLAFTACPGSVDLSGWVFEWGILQEGFLPCPHRDIYSIHTVASLSVANIGCILTEMEHAKYSFKTLCKC